ncbi:hypothetical protein [Actinorugispora endophytica]|uniref:hypothetical protein n=1 Tax=Actinorugispora endophytica TaxID=1605990 RepID=UPI001FB6A617|nr:hypothetical protein [Actinorugispora endophytica]
MGGVNPSGAARDGAAHGPLAVRLSGAVRDPVVLLGAALIAASLLLRGWVLRHAYFVEDDFLFVARAAASPLTVEYLTELHKGHLMPGALLLVYVQTAVAPYSWPLTAGIMLALQGGAAAAAFRLLWVLFGRRWAILAPLAVYVFSPLTVPVLTWWSAALNGVPLQLAVALALLWTVRHLREGGTRFAWMAAGAVLLGMAFSVKAMLLPPLLFAVAAAFCTPGRLSRAPGAALAARPRFWLGMAALTAGHLLVYLSRPRDVEGAGVPRLDVGLGMARRLLAETFPVGAVGGPVRWTPVTPAGGLLEPHPGVVAAAWAVLGALVLLSLLHRRRAWRAWAVLAGYLVCADVLPTLIARGRYQELTGYDPRYVADAAPVLALCLALAFLPTWKEAGQGPVHRGGRIPLAGIRSATVAATALFLLVSGYSTYAYASTLSGDRVRWYLDTVRFSVANVPDGAGIYPRPVPQDIVLPWNGERRFSSHLLSPLAEGEVAERVADPRPSALPLVFNDAGFLVNAEPAPESTFFGPPEGEECVAAVDGQVLWPVQSLGGPGLVAGLAYTSGGPTEATLVVGDTVAETTLPAAPRGASWYVPLDGAGTRLLVAVEEDVCLQWVTFGDLVPTVEGNPWHQEGEEEEEEAD